MKKSFKNVMASLMAVVSLAVVTGIGTCAANSFNGAKCSSKVIYGITNYRGEGYADGSISCPYFSDSFLIDYTENAM